MPFLNDGASGVDEQDEAPFFAASPQQQQQQHQQQQGKY
jgi:hypothetical protein